MKMKIFKFKDLKKIILDYVNKTDEVPKEIYYLENFMIKHGVMGGSFDDILKRRRNYKQFAKQIILNILCWVFAIRLITDLIIFMKINIKNYYLLNYYGYFGNAFGKDKVSISFLSGILVGMFSLFHTCGKINYKIIVIPN